MNIRHYMYTELHGYCSLTDDLENILGWSDDDFNNAFKCFLSHYEGNEDPLRNLFITSESFELDLKKRLENAFIEISKDILFAWSDS